MEFESPRTGLLQSTYIDADHNLNITSDVQHLLSQDETLNSISTPILFLQPFKDIPNEVLKLLGIPIITYQDEDGYSINKLITYLFGVNMFQFAGVMGLAFLASIVLVAIILPNLYFRVMLLTDRTSSVDDLVVSPEDLLGQSAFTDDEDEFMEKIQLANEKDGFQMKEEDWNRLAGGDSKYSAGKEEEEAQPVMTEEEGAWDVVFSEDGYVVS